MIEVCIYVQSLYILINPILSGNLGEAEESPRGVLLRVMLDCKRFQSLSIQDEYFAIFSKIMQIKMLKKNFTGVFF